MNRVARLLVVIVALVGAATAGSARVAVAADAGTTTAVVVIDTGIPNDPVRAITVDVGNGMSGLAVLQRVANVTTLAFSGNGGAVCSIDGVGNEASQSACLVGPNSQYWAYFHSSGGATSWTYSPVGAGSFTVHGGDVEGWRYGTGQKPAASPAFCDYVTCAPPPPATTTPPSAGSGSGSAPGTGSSAGSATPGSGGATVAAGGTAAGTSGDGTAAGDPQAATTTTIASSAATANGSSTGRNGEHVRVQAAAASQGGGTDSGSPVGVAVAAALLAIAAGSAVFLRRRSRVPG